VTPHPIPFGRVVALTIWFVVLWLMLWADVNLANILSGVALGATIALMTRRASPAVEDSTVRVSPIALVHFVGHVLWQLVKSNVALAWEIVTPTNTIETGTVDVPLRSSSPIITMAVSNVVTLTPGTVTLDARSDPPALTIAVLHLHDPDDIRRGVQRTERLAIEAFGTRTARAALASEHQEVPA
jgi:multicomponent Na+:H+ antiporter subunit E